MSIATRYPAGEPPQQAGMSRHNATATRERRWRHGGGASGLQRQAFLRFFRCCILAGVPASLHKVISYYHKKTLPYIMVLRGCVARGVDGLRGRLWVSVSGARSGLEAVTGGVVRLSL